MVWPARWRSGRSFPTRFTRISASMADASTQTPSGRTVFVSNGCAACHGQGAQGTHFAPTLTGITKKYPPAQLTNLLHHPQKTMNDGGMPAVKVNEAQMQQLVAYLSGLGTVRANESEAADHGTQSASVQSPNQRKLPKRLRQCRLVRRLCRVKHSFSTTVVRPGTGSTGCVEPKHFYRLHFDLGSPDEPTRGDQTPKVSCEHN
jgi:mono/diheme cytochrome c family protein